MPVREAVALVNLCPNPSFENGSNAGNGGFNSVSAGVTSFPNDGGRFGSSYIRRTYSGATPEANLGVYMGDLTTASYTPGEKITVSYYVRPSINLTSARPVLEQSSGSPTLYGVNTTCPPNVWTRVSRTFTTTATATTIRPCFYIANFTPSAGVTVDFDGLMVTRTDFVTDYKDGSFDGWSWTGTANASTSVGPYFVDKLIKVRTELQNSIVRPNFDIGWYAYSSGTNVGMRDVTGNVCTLTATSLTGGNRRFGIGNGGVAAHLGSPVMKANEWRITMRAKVDTSGLAPGTRATFYTDIRNGAAYLGSRTLTANVGGTELYHSSVVTHDFTLLESFFWINAVPNADWAGTSTVKVSEVMITFHRENAVIEYFDGNSVGAYWNGASGNSRSMKPIWVNAPINVNAIVNKVMNPNFVGSGASATGWNGYAAGGGAIGTNGTRLYANNTLTVTATALNNPSGSRRFGSSIGVTQGSNANTRVFVPAGSVIYASVKVDTTLLDPNTQPFIYHEARRSDGSVRTYVESTTIVGDRLIATYTAPEDIYYNIYFIVGIRAVVDWSGTSTVVFSECLWTHLKPGETAPSFFSGDTNGAAWLGTPNNSQSVMTGWRNALT